ncbi:uncharacterized protein LOC122378167 [Amphibalanus amphitrite]|uniref:uncharacterized protein LOC122378167 n=1 Tax=Amphibalanus amphitrite TaxID=1232801 RepID=UPI001C90CC55|nr:uncharacterized protein LOC122378167 [Amphibalanus amphitrite]
MRVCSKHFKPTDFLPAAHEHARRFLKKGAVPSENIPLRSTDRDIKKAQRDSAREDRVARRAGRVQLACVDEQEQDEPQLDEGDRDMAAAEALLELQQGISKMADASIQVSLNSVEKGDVCGFIKSDQDLRVITGIPSFSVLDALEKHDQTQLPSLQDVRKGIIISMMRLKLGLSFTSLGVLARLDRTTCAKLFKAVVPALAKTLKDVIDWPSKEEVLNWMPKSFKKFPKTRVILDCTEVVVEKCHCLNCRVRTYSQYYSDHTIKFMVGCAPCGSISFVSSAYVGRVSDKFIFNDSGITQLLEPYIDAVMVDKGFQIEEDCLSSAIELIRPPFLRAKKQLSSAEAKKTAEIARARVHVERAIQRLKLFAVMKNKLKWSMLNYVDELIIIVCGITNLQAPILADDRF